MSEAGLPGPGVKLGPELFRGPKGIWFTGVAADGADVGVLRIDPQALAGPGALAALIERVVAARAGGLAGAVTVADLVEDAADEGQVWLITAEVPAREVAARTEELLLAPAEAVVVAGPAAAASGGIVPGGILPDGIVPDGNAPAGLAAEPAPVSGTGEEPPVVVPIGSRIGLAIRVVVGLALVGGIIGAAVVFGDKVGSKPRSTPLQIAGILVESPGGYTSSSICNVSLPMRAVLQTNGGMGTVTFEWDLPGAAPVKASKQVSGDSPQELDLTWDLRLHGKGTVTAKFVVDNAGVLAPGAVATASTSLPYQCP